MYMTHEQDAQTQRKTARAPPLVIILCVAKVGGASTTMTTTMTRT